MKVDLSITLAPQTDSKAPAIAAGDAELFAQELITAQGMAGGVVPDTGPPDPGPAPGIPGVGEAVPFQPNAEEQEPDLQPQTTASPIPVIVPQDYLLAASFVQGLVTVPSGLAESPVKVAPLQVLALSTTPANPTVGDWMLGKAQASTGTTAEVNFTVTPLSVPPFSVDGPKVSLVQESLVTGVQPQESDFADLPGGTPIVAKIGDFTLNGIAQLEKGQNLDTKMLAALSPTTLSLKQSFEPTAPVAQPSLQVLIAGMRKAEVSVMAPSEQTEAVVQSPTVGGAPVSLPTTVLGGPTANGAGNTDQIPTAQVAFSPGARPATSLPTPGLAVEPTIVPNPSVELGESLPVELSEDSVLLQNGPGAPTSPIVAKVLATPAVALPREVANEVVNQLIDRIQEMEAFRPNNQMVMKLNPEHLGAITIVLRTSRGETDAEITSSNEQVHQALDAARPALQRTIEVKGVNLTSLSLQFGSEGGAAPQQEQQHEAQRAYQLFQHIPLRSNEIEPTTANQYNLNGPSNLNLVI